MSYRIYKPEPLTSEMTRVMQDWYDGRNSVFFKVSIGASGEKRLRPSVKKHFSKIAREAHQALSEMTDETAKEYPNDVDALQSLNSWAVRQCKIIDAREALERAVKTAVESGMISKDIVFYVQDAVSARLLPND